MYKDIQYYHKRGGGCLQQLVNIFVAYLISVLIMCHHNFGIEKVCILFFSCHCFLANSFNHKKYIHRQMYNSNYIN